MEPQTLKREILERGIKSLMDEASVPMRMHLKVIQKLQQHDKAHKADIQKWAQVVKMHREEIASHKETKKRYHELLDAAQEEIERRQLEKGEPGLDGYTPVKGVDYVDGADGVSPSLEEIVAQVIPHIPEPIPGTPGRDGVDGFDGKNGEVKIQKVATQIVKIIKEKQMLDLTHIKGASKFIKDGVSYKIEELMHGGGGKNTPGGGGGAIFVETPNGLIDGSNRVYTTTQPIGIVVGLDYNGEAIHPSEYTVSGSGFTMGTALPVIPGAAFTIAYQGTSTIPTGTGINPQVPSGTINGTNKTFTATGVVSVISSDGQVLNPTSDYSTLYNAGTNVTTITYILAPQSAVFAF